MTILVLQEGRNLERQQAHIDGSWNPQSGLLGWGVVLVGGGGQWHGSGRPARGAPRNGHQALIAEIQALSLALDLVDRGALHQDVDLKIDCRELHRLLRDRHGRMPHPGPKLMNHICGLLDKYPRVSITLLGSGLDSTTGRNLAHSLAATAATDSGEPR